jgi:hypothetical protein
MGHLSDYRNVAELASLPVLQDAARRGDSASVNGHNTVL